MGAPQFGYLTSINAHNSVKRDVLGHFSQPERERYPKSLLRSMNDIRRQSPSEHFFQEILSRPIAIFEFSRQLSREFDQIVVEERRARFQRVHHGRPIDLG